MADPKKPRGTDIVTVTDEFGNPYQIERSKLASVLDPGRKQVSNEVFEKAQRKAELETGGQIAATALEGAGSGLTFGLSRVLGNEIGGEEYRKAQAERAEANPIASIGGELTGALLPLAFSGGTSSFASAGRVAGALPRGVSALGRAAEVGVERAIGKGVLSKAAQGAVEGAFYGGGSAVSQSALRDQTLTGEQLLAAMGHGAIMGGAMGGGLGLLGKALRGAPKALSAAEPVTAKGAAKAVSTLDSTVSGVVSHTDELAVKGGGARLELSIPEQVYSTLRGGDTREVMGLLKNEQTRRMLTQDLHEATSRLGREAKRAWDVSEDAIEAVHGITRGEGKAQQMARLVGDADAAAAKTSALDTVAQLKTSIEEMAAKAEVGQYKSQTVARMRSQLEKFELGVQRAETASDTFMAMDRLKREWGQFAKGKGAEGLAAQNQYESFLRPHLEDSALYGAAADAQKAINAPWSDLIGLSKGAEPLVEYNSRLKIPGRPWEDKFRGDSDKFRGILSGAGETRSEAALQVLGDHARARVQFLRAVREHYQLSGSQLEAINKAEQAAQKWESTVKDAVKEVEITKLGQRVEAQGGGMASTIAGQIPGVGGALKAVLDVNPITVAKKTKSAIGLANRVMGMVKAIAHGEAISPANVAAKQAHAAGVVGTVAEKVQRRIDAGIGGYFSAVPAAARIAAVVRKPAPVADSKKVYEDKRDQLASINANPSVLVDAVSKRLGSVAEHVPGIAESFTMTAMRGADFLHSKLPPTPQFSSLTPQLTNWTPDPVELAKFSRYSRAVDDPVSVIDDLNAGRVNPEGLEAVRSVYPSLFADIQGRIVDKLADLKEPLPYNKSVELSLFLGIPGHTSLEPQSIARLQSLYLPSAPQDPDKAPIAPQRKVTIASQLKSKSDQIESTFGGGNG